MRQIHQAAASVRARVLIERGLTGLALAEALRLERLAAITEARREFGEIRAKLKLPPHPLPSLA
jgi:hypothetical protein